MTHCPDDGGSKYLWNVGKLLPDYTALQPRRQPSLYSLPWEPQILIIIIDLLLAKSWGGTFKCDSHHVLYLLPYHFELNPTELIRAQIEVLSCDCGLRMSLACPCSLSMFTSAPYTYRIEHRGLFLGRGWGVKLMTHLHPAKIKKPWDFTLQFEMFSGIKFLF
jgi:hypothetical protein